MGLLKDKLWKWAAKWLSHPDNVDFLIEESAKTPYFHLEGYMNRYWLFNPYNFDMEDKYKRKREAISWLPSIRLHHILREDQDRHLHDHPWDARTIILRGWYKERKEDGQVYLRQAGDTNPIRYGEYHSITEVSEGGVWTLFFTWKYMGTWGFLVEGIKIPWRKYLGEQESTS